MKFTVACNCNNVNPIVCPAQYVVRDYYTPQYVPVIHPVVTVNRQNVVNVPQHYVQPVTTNVVVPAQGLGVQGGAGNQLFSQGFGGQGFGAGNQLFNQGFAGFGGRRFL